MMKERGNILFLILLAVVLFAALSYAVTSSLRGGGNDAGNEKAQAAAAEIINYGALLEQTVTRLRVVKDCTPNEINFINGVDTSYNAHTPQRADKKCNVFDAAGGNMSWKLPNLAWLTTTADAATFLYAGADHGVFNIHNNVCVSNIARACNAADAQTKQLILGLKWLRRDVCEAINVALGYKSENYSSAIGCSPVGDSGRFLGTHPASGIFSCANFNEGRRQGCLYSSRSGYSYWHVLLTQ